MNSSTLSMLERVIVVARSVRADYGTLPRPVVAPELPDGQARTVAQLAVRELFQVWGLDKVRSGTAQWNPLGDIIPQGSRVVLKPNWVAHENQSRHDLDCLVTHSSVIEAILEYVVLTRPNLVILGDAPIQRCDFAVLRSSCDLDNLVNRFRDRGLNISLCDFRRTLLANEGHSLIRHENIRSLDQFTVFDLKEQSLLEQLTQHGKFRVTVYNPDLLDRTHGPGKHQYLVAREIMEADVVLSLPKLKCHKKACITGALKNVIGINGNKEYLPHHRKGGGAVGGDCYASKSWLKAGAEELLDRANRRSSGPIQQGLLAVTNLLVRGASLLGRDDNMDGSWHGNDTIWRTCLDLQRILRYGKADGTMGCRPQRHVITITDAIIAGEGDGPLAPLPVNTGLLTGALNPAAADWIHAYLMGFDPQKIPLVREAFSRFPYPLATFEPKDLRVRLAEGERSANGVDSIRSRPFLPPEGWQNHCELKDKDDRANNQPIVVA